MQAPGSFYIEQRPQGGLQDTLELLWRRRWLMLLVIAIVLGAATAFAATRPTLYTAEATVLVSGTGLTPGTDDPTEVNLATERRFASSSQIAVVVGDALDLPTPPGDLADEIDVEELAGTEFLLFSYTHREPETAQERAQAFADAYLEVRRDQVVENILSSTEGLQERISETNLELRQTNQELSVTVDEARRATLQARANSLIGQIALLEQQISSLTPTDNFQVGQVVDQAEVPDDPSSPNYLAIVALALASGIGLAIGVAFLRDRLDDRIHSIGDVEFAIQAPVLATVPTIKAWRKGDEGVLNSLKEIDAPETEAYRGLRTSIMYGAKQRGMRCILVTSANPQEGKSTVVANLGVALARSGRKVIIVSGDLRRPRLDRLFPPQKPAGLTTVLAGEHEVYEALQPADFDNIRVLHTGPVPGNPTELLSSSTLARVIETLKEMGDFVLIDAAPVLGVADALALAPQVDAVLLVMNAQRTDLNQLSQTMHTLHRVSAHVIGGVLNNVRGNRIGTYSTRYGYYPTYRSDEVLRGAPRSGSS